MRPTAIAGALLLASLQLRATAAGTQHPNRIVLNVVDRAASSKETLNQAQHAVSRLFASVGVSLLWRDAPVERQRRPVC